MSSLLSITATILLAAGSAADGSQPRSVTVNAERVVTLDIPCAAGELIRASVAPDLQPVIAVLRDPSDALLAEVRNPVLLDEPVPIAGVSARSGTCTLALSLENGPPGEVMVRTDAPRQATALDRVRIEGERAHQRALLLWSEGSEASQRQAVELEARAAELAHQSGDVRGEAEAHAGAGGVLWQLGELEAAARELSASIELRTRLGDPRALAVAYNDRAVVLTLTNPSSALEDLHRARALAEPVGNAHLLAEILHNIAFLHWTTKEYERALEVFRESRRVAARGSASPSLQAVTTDTIGMVLFDLERYAEAETQFRASLAAHRARGDRRQQAISLTHLGWVYGDTGRLALAEQVYREALELLTVVGDRFNLAFALDGLGEVLALRGQTEEALAQHRASLRIAEQAPDINQQAISLTNMARALRKLGRLDESLQALRQAVALTESDRLTRPGTSGRMSFTARNRDRYELLVSVLWDLQQRGPERARVEEMFWISERARARTFLDLLSESRIDLDPGADPELLSRERRLVQEADRVSAEAARRTGLGSSSGADLPELRRILMDLEDVRSRLRERNPRSAALTRPEALRAAAVQSDVLDEDTILLEYLLGADRSFLFVLSRDSVEVHPLPARKGLEKQVRELRHRMQSLQADAAERRLASRLGRTLLGPAAERIAGKRVAIAADGALHELPFPGLVLRHSGRRLVEEHEVVLVPSASAVAALRASARAGPHAGVVAVLADPVFDRRDPRLQGKRAGALALPTDLQRSMDTLGLQRLPRLLGTRIEAEQILSLVPADQRLGALDFDARRTLALDPAVGRYRVLHFATHGLLNSTHPELSGLVLSLVDARGEAQNGFLRLQDVYQMRIDADLVVLSACQTALGKPVSGEGLVGLTRGFIHAGARQVLSSLWKVSDRATTELMKEVYRAMLLDGQRPGAALRQAQRKLLLTRPFDAPGSWAAFVVQGDWLASPRRSGDAPASTSP
ncbi:MAG TPA: CHAT domain-containing tetratricopeptide repeat protein [Myxococcaceae bacterium]|nr:CHAT domain-containing tetratricopeptide repeat protein [Myxococcaceae bacterium]